MRRTLLILAALTLILILAAGVAYLEIKSLLLPAAKTTTQVVVDVPPGVNAAQIGVMLEQQNVIRSARAFRYMVALRDVGGRLKAGEHVLDASLPLDQIIDRLIQGRYKLYPFTVPEGLTMRQIADLAAEHGLADRDAFLALCRDPSFIAQWGLEAENLEGYLFPDTYHFLKNTRARDVITAMLRRFFTVWTDLAPQAEASGLSRPQIVTLASIVEKETGAAEERPLIAAVFLNRLEKGMRLQTDPTVIYGLLPDFDGNLTKKDLRTHTPYNTYVIDGLPPGPICNPGRAALTAVLAPADADYLYFVSKNDGTHYFSESLREHNRAVNYYQRGRGPKP